MKDKEELFKFYDIDEFSDLWDKDERLVFIDTGTDELVARYEDIPDIIVDMNLKLGTIDLSIYEFSTCQKIITTLGMYLNKCNPAVREDIIDRLIKLQTMTEKPNDYKLFTEESLDEFYRLCDAIEFEDLLKEGDINDGR